ncbi:hypothetical protein DFH27DRAFT_580525 [Peziza echinospora]|nr:hypothetical protein DFH27DRAFT_580525 [Peziza echinospora]
MGRVVLNRNPFLLFFPCLPFCVHLALVVISHISLLFIEASFLDFLPFCCFLFFAHTTRISVVGFIYHDHLLPFL